MRVAEVYAAVPIDFSMPPWAPFAVAEGRLVTGQNPAPDGPWAELVLTASQ